MVQRTGEQIVNEKRALTVLDMCYIAVFTAIITIMAQISVPLPGGVPLTLQTLAVPLAGIILGAKRGTISTILYVILGAVGTPVFAGFVGGLQFVLGMTGGFIFSFPLMALMSGIGAQVSFGAGERKVVKIIAPWLGLVIGAILNYAVGTVWFMVVARVGIETALAACVIPFIPTAILKIILAGIIGPILRRALIKAGLLR